MKDEIINEISKINREGKDKLITFLSESDFFEAPCSTKYHCSYAGGLAEHSWNVYELLQEKNKRYNLELDEDSIIICGLLHDICKAHFYRKSGNTYVVDDSLPLGHGEKSVIVIQNFIKLTKEESLMIRWHMSAFNLNFTDYTQTSAYYKAVKLYPTVLALFTADYEATTFIEKWNEQDKQNLISLTNLKKK